MGVAVSDDPAPPGEFDLIAWFRARSRPANAATVMGIGDDCAILRPTPGVDLVVTTDMLMDGRHFVLRRDGPEAVGGKAMAVNVSDVAAMAARPVAAVVAVALPKAFGAVGDLARGLHDGLSAVAGRFGVAVVGGDTNAWDGPLVIAVTLLGEATDRGLVRRSGAKVGDAIFVTGPLGGSLLGRHLRPCPRVEEALALHAAGPLDALIDISDGLNSDLRHVLAESGGLGAVLEAGAIPVHADARELAGVDGRSPLDHALNDGEDFELCVVVPLEVADALERDPPPPACLYRVGTVVAGPGVWLRSPDGTTSPLARGGFDHLSA